MDIRAQSSVDSRTWVFKACSKYLACDGGGTYRQEAKSVLSLPDGQLAQQGVPDGDAVLVQRGEQPDRVQERPHSSPAPREIFPSKGFPAAPVNIVTLCLNRSTL